MKSAASAWASPLWACTPTLCRLLALDREARHKLGQIRLHDYEGRGTAAALRGNDGLRSSRYGRELRFLSHPRRDPRAHDALRVRRGGRAPRLPVLIQAESGRSLASFLQRLLRTDSRPGSAPVARNSSRAAPASAGRSGEAGARRSRSARRLPSCSATAGAGSMRCAPLACLLIAFARKG